MKPIFCGICLKVKEGHTTQIPVFYRLHLERPYQTLPLDYCDDCEGGMREFVKEAEEEYKRRYVAFRLTGK